jgi:hypothetical protein
MFAENHIEMKKVYLFLGAILILIGISACWKELGRLVRGNGNLIQETRTIAEFNGIKSVGSFNVELRHDSIHRVEIDAESNLINHIETNVQNKILTVSPESGVNLKPSKLLKIVVYSPDIKIVNITGSSSVRVEELNRPGKDIIIQISGSGSFIGAVNAQEIYANVSGSGSVTLNGEAEYAEFNVSGSGKIEAFDCPINEVIARLSGSGKIDVFALDKLDVNISGSGVVRYKGNPIVSSNISGSGKLRKI